MKQLKVIGVFIVALLLATVVFSGPAHAASTPKVSIKASSTSVNPGSNVKFTGKVTKRSAGAKVSLQMYNTKSKKWETIKNAKVSKKKKYSITVKAAVGSNKYRVRVNKNKKIKAKSSATRTVRGNFRTSVSPPMADETFTLSAQLPHDVRGGSLEARVDNKWVSLLDFTMAKPGGVVSAPVSFDKTTPVRLVGGKKSGNWTSTTQNITVVKWDRVATNKLVAELNVVRKKAKKPAVKLDVALANVAYNWSKHLHDNSIFMHNPNYSKQIPKGWKRAGENIAAGQQLNEVTQAWVDSKPHYKNMIGDFNRVGIAVYTGDNNYKRYYTTVFGKY